MSRGSLNTLLLITGLVACSVPAAGASLEARTIAPGQATQFSWASNDGAVIDPHDQARVDVEMMKAGMLRLTLTANADDRDFAAFEVSLNVPYKWDNDLREVAVAMVNSDVSPSDRVWLVRNGGEMLGKDPSKLAMLNQRARVATRQVIDRFTANPSDITALDITVVSFFLLSSSHLASIDFFVDRDKEMERASVFLDERISKDQDLFTPDLLKQDRDALFALQNARRSQMEYVVNGILSEIEPSYTRLAACDRAKEVAAFLRRPGALQDDFGGRGRNRVKILAASLNCLQSSLALGSRIPAAMQIYQTAFVSADATLKELESVLNQFTPSGTRQGRDNDEAAIRLARNAQRQVVVLQTSGLDILGFPSSSSVQ
ncbi:MAG: hypothetical protein ABIQ30_09840 [Devosia sp.]